MLEGHDDPHGPTWDRLGEACEVTVHPRTSADQTVERIGQAPMVLTNKVPITADVLKACPTLKYIGVMATGVNVVDLEAAAQHDVVVTNVPSYSTASVAQHVMAMMLAYNVSLADTDKAVHEGQWAGSSDFSFTLAPWYELVGKAMGIVGMGEIGTAVGRRAHAMGMEVYAQSRTVKDDLGFPVHWLGVNELFSTCDYISLHCPLTPDTQEMVNAQTLKLCKPSAVIINTGRGGLIDETALANALQEQRIGGALLDVLSTEPPSADNPLLSAPHCVITPHIAWASVEARNRLMDTLVENVQAFLRGEPVHRVG